MIDSRTLFVGVLLLSTVACGPKMSGQGGRTSAAGTASASPAPNASPQTLGLSSAALNYQGSVLNADIALHGLGTWVTIRHQRFFVPSASLTGRNWQPYQNGHWMYDRTRGWTWVSSDRFGWITDHYGIWRHHRVHGWIWLPFHDMRYVPHAVTWFDDGDSSAILGWYPYHGDYKDGYALGTLDGFNDGYWRGTLAVSDYISGAETFQLGFSAVLREHAAEKNLRAHMVQDKNLIWSTAQRAYRSGRFDRDVRHPGGDKARAYGFLQLHARSKAPVGKAETIRSRGGARFIQPRPERR